jgi:pimeloyl-ACP methyl ester carboxylesterase
MADLNHYRTVGDGPVRVLALHGWFGSAGGWGPFVDMIDGDAFTYAFMDARGYGGSRDRRGEYTMEEIAADGIAVADDLGWDRFSVLGHSMGAVAAQRALLSAKERVASLVVVNPVPASGVPMDDNTWDLFAGAANSTDARRAIINFSTGDRLSRRWLDAMVRHSVDISNVDAFGAYLPSWAKADFVKEVEGNPAKVKVIIGEHDPALPAEMMRATWLTHFPNAELEVLANAGHYPMFETPVALATSIESYLRAG